VVAESGSCRVRGPSRYTRAEEEVDNCESSVVVVAKKLLVEKGSTEKVVARLASVLNIRDCSSTVVDPSTPFVS